MLIERKDGMKLSIVLTVAIVSIITIAMLPPIPQNPDYHNFADTRNWMGLPNASNVLSNIGFIIAGIVGVLRLRRMGDSPPSYIWSAFAVASVLVGVGSGYYHWQPSTDTLFWDRLPMTFGFAAITAGICADRMGLRSGGSLFGLLLIGGIGSVVYWRVTEYAGAGDLRPYIVAQYLPMLLVPVILILFSRGITQDRSYCVLLAGYGVAKAFEWLDGTIYGMTGGLVSGHAVKHLAAAAGIYLFLELRYKCSSRAKSGAGEDDKNRGGDPKCWKKYLDNAVNYFLQ